MKYKLLLITLFACGLGWGQLLIENFDYLIGSNLTNNNWSVTGTNTTPYISVSAASINYPGYMSSNIGQQVSLSNSGQDVNRVFPSQTTGTVFCSFLVNVSSVASTTGDYFFNFGATTIGTNYRGRVFVKKDSSNNLSFGIAQSSTAVNYTSAIYSLNTTYLIVVKFDIINGTSNDTSSIYVNPVLNDSIPLTGWITSTDTPSTDLADVGSIGIRQGSASNAATLIIDGIRVSNKWSDIVGSIIYTNSWSNTTGPTASLDAIIDGDLTTTTDLVCKDLTINSGKTLTIGAGKKLTVSGNLINNGTIVFKSSAIGSAMFDVFNGAQSGTGVVTVERFIPSGKRAFRLLSPAVTTTNFISNNWQQQTHITGGASGGFDATETNNPSMFTYDNQAAQGVSGWTPIANTNSTNLTAGVGYRVLIRGDRTASNITAASADSMNAAITLSATGTLRTGTVTLNSSSTPSINNTTNSVTNGYSLVGNPYQSAVDWNAVTKSGIDATYWAWDPNMGTTAQRGRYVSFNGSTNSVLDGAGSPQSYVGQFIQPGQAFFVKNTGSSAGTLTFEEAHKATTSANVFRNANIPTLAVALYDPNELAIGGYPIDATKAVFSAEYSNELGLGDAEKLEAAGENIAWYRNNTKLAIEAVAPATSSDELVMKTIRLGANKNYTFKINTTNFDADLTPYLVDNFLNTQTAISTSEVYLANFSTTSNVASYGEDRFKIVFQTSALSTDDFANNIKLYPNPAKTGASFYLDGITEATVSVYNVVGQNIPVTVMSQGNATQVTPKTALSQGVYLVTITTAGKTAQVKWIVE